MCARDATTGPDLERRTGLKTEFLVLASATVAAQLSRFGTLAIAARWSDPAEFGKWNALQLLLLYGMAATLGVPHGLGVELPRLSGAGRHDDARDLELAAVSSAAIALLVAGAACAALGASDLAPAGYGGALVAMGLLFPAWMLYQLAIIRQRASGRFGAMSALQFALALLLPLVALPLTALAGVEGFIVGQAIAALLVVFPARLGGSIDVRRRVALRWVRHAARVGLPLLAAALIYNLLVGVDRMMILHFLGTQALGMYTLPILCAAALNLLPSVISQQMYPRMAYRFGQTADPAALRSDLMRQVGGTAAVVLPVLLAVYFALPVVAEALLPQYVAGVAPARVLVLGLLLLALGGGPANFLVVIGQRGLYAALNTASVSLCVLLDWVLLERGLGLLAVAYGALIAFAVHAVALHIAAHVLIRRARRAKAAADEQGL